MIFSGIKHKFTKKLNTTMLRNYSNSNEINKKEILSAVNFIIFIVILYSDKYSSHKLKKFKFNLTKSIDCYYKNCWFPLTPLKGENYRLIYITEQYICPILSLACIKSNWSPKILYNLLPVPFCIWINPYEVFSSLGENSRLFLIYHPNSTEIWTKPQPANVNKIIVTNHFLSNCFLLDPRLSIDIELLAKYCT